MAIEIGEYTGDATGAGRVITPGGTIRNLAAVFVFHLTGGNWYHYLRVRAQPDADTDSVAMIASENDTGLNGRQNKITAMTATTFTVGSDLNVDGDDYWFIALDEEPGYVASGAFTGDGGFQEPNSVLTLGGGLFTIPTSVDGQAAFHATGSVGKIVETTAAHALGSGHLVATITSVAASAAGTQTITATMAPGFQSGTLAGLQWRQRHRRIALPFAPDLLFVFRTTTTTSDSVPGTGTLGQLGWWHRAALNISADTSRMDTPSGISDADRMYVDPNEAALYVKVDQREDNDGNQGPNIEDEPYFWFAIRAGGPNNTRRISYVGNGDANPVHLHGGTFDPLLAFIMDDLTANAESRIYPSGISPVAAGRSLNWIHGQGVETNMLMTYETAGVHMAGAGSGFNMNINNALYAGLLMRSGHNYTEGGSNLTLYMSHPQDVDPDLRLTHPNDVGAQKLSHPADDNANLRMGGERLGS